MTAFERAQSMTKKELRQLVEKLKKTHLTEYEDRQRVCYEKYLAGDMDQARWFSNHAELVAPK